MPVYSFFCEDDHETEWIGSYSSLPKTFPCTECGKPGARKPTVSRHLAPDVETRKSYVNVRHSGLSLHDFQCEKCGHVFDEVIDHAEGESAIDGQECPECGEHAHWVPNAMIDRSSETYPYYDRGAGRRFESKHDRREWLKRNPNIEAVEGDWDPDKESAARRREEEELLKGYDEYAKRLEDDPGFADYRRARDQGRI